MSAPVDPQALSMAEDRAKNIADSPGGKVLQLLIRRPNGDVDELTDQEVDALKQLACNYREFSPVYRYLTSPAERPLQGKELARACGLVLSKKAGHSLHILGLPHMTKGHGLNEVRLRTEEEIVENFDQLNADITEKYELHIERIIWEQWVHRSGSSLDATKLSRILGKVSAAFLWDLKTKCMTENNFPECALESLEKLFFGMPSSLSSLYSAEINAILRQLKVFLPDFTVDDFLFGDTYNLIDPHDTNAFMKLYIKALIILLNCDSYADESFQNFANVFQSWEGSSLLEANTCLDFALFSRLWDGLYNDASTEWKPTDHILKTSLFAQHLRNPSFVHVLVEVIHGNIRLYAGHPVRRRARRVAEARQKSFYACYSAVCQTSGSGKTKNMIGMGEFALLFYICTRPKYTHGFPLRSKIFDFISQFKCAADFVIFFYALFDVFLEWTNDQSKLSTMYDPEEPSPNFLKSFSLRLADTSSMLHDSFWDEVQTKTILYKTRELLQHYNEVHYNERKTLSFIDEISSKLAVNPMYVMSDEEKKNLEAHVILSEVKVNLSSRMNSIVEKCLTLPGACPFAQEPKIPIIMVFDEARNLFTDDFKYMGSLFRMLRHVMVEFHGNGYFLFADTTSRTANFAPASTEDPSSRAWSLGHDLFPPILHFLSMNVLSVSWPHGNIFYLHTKAHNDKWAKLEYDLLDCVARGRPLFVVSCNSNITMHPDKRFQHCVGFALSKLLPAKSSLDHVRSLVNKKQILRAAAACLLDLTFSSFEINDQLVASYLAFGESLSHDRHHLRARYMAEAVIQEACARLHQADRRGFVCQLASDVECAVPIQCDTGLKGEILAGYYLLLAKFHLDDQKQQFYAKPSTVYDFFAVLFHSDPEVLNMLPVDTANSFVAFNAIRRTDRVISNGHLLNAWRRRVILLCKPGTKAIDLVIPIVKGHKGDQPVKPSIDNISCIVVQVKNWGKNITEGHAPVSPPSKRNKVTTPKTSKDSKSTVYSQVTTPKTSKVSKSTVYDMGCAMLSLVKQPHRTDNIGIIMAVGKGGFVDCASAVTKVDGGAIFKLSVTELRRHIGINDEGLEDHFLDLNDPLMKLEDAVERQCQTLPEDTRIKEMATQVSRNLRINCDSDAASETSSTNLEFYSDIEIEIEN